MTEVDKHYQQAIHTIFITDDDDDDRVLVSHALKEINPSFLVRVFENCQTLYSMLEHVIPDLIILDLDMPGKNGLQCMQEIRKNEIAKDIPIIVFSSTSRDTNIQVAYEMGADLFLIKPNEFSSLVRSFDKVLNLDWNNRHGIRESLSVNDHYKAFSG